MGRPLNDERSNAQKSAEDSVYEVIRKLPEFECECRQLINYMVCGFDARVETDADRVIDSLNQMVYVLEGVKLIAQSRTNEKRASDARGGKIGALRPIRENEQ